MIKVIAGLKKKNKTTFLKKKVRLEMLSIY